MEKISVIIPVYKAEQYLRDCVDSVLSQTYSNLEVILVDDGSPDHCGAICDEYAAKDRRVMVIHKDNAGVSEARNAGMDAATGDWLIFVDADDLVNAHYAAFLKKAQEATQADLVYCGCTRFSDQIPDTAAPDCYDNHQVEVFDREQAMANAFGIWYKPNIWGKLIRRSLFRDLRFPKAKRAEDLWVSYHLLARCEKVAGMRHYNPYYYRNTPGSAMSKITAQYIEDDMNMRLDIFESLFVNRYETTEMKLARQTKRIFLDFAICTRASHDADCYRALRHWGRQLYRKMWKPTAKGMAEKLDYGVLNLSVRAWTLLQLVKYKLFKIPLYLE